MQAPTHMAALKLNLDTFSHPSRRKAAELIQKYILKYKTVPSLSALRSFSERYMANDIAVAEDCIAAFAQLQDLPKVRTDDAKFEFDQAENFRIGRELVDTAEYLRSKFERGSIDYTGMRKELINKLLATGSADDTVSRGMIYDRVRQRADSYLRAERGEIGDIIPYGIKALDEKLGGMRKTFLTLIYSKTGGGKTRTAINIAYNAAMAGYRVMYVSLEMAFDFLASCIDSRIAWVDSNQIIFGKLSTEDKLKYSKALKKQVADKLNIWIVDIAMGATASTLLEELELYKAAHGMNPDLMIIDYANLMEPAKQYLGRSEKYDNLFQEFHEVAKYANIAIITATQESRDASRADIESRKSKKQEVEEGVHNIGLSNFMAPHCETVIRLKQDKKDRMQNRLWAVIDKNRYGVMGTEIPLMSIWERNYVGDRNIENMKVYKLRSSADILDKEDTSYGMHTGSTVKRLAK